jgi:hypothetical protein
LADTQALGWDQGGRNASLVRGPTERRRGNVAQTNRGLNWTRKDEVRTAEEYQDSLRKCGWKLQTRKSDDDGAKVRTLGGVHE